MSDTVGKYLKEIRESNNIDIDKITQNTKIPIEFIIQIENDDFSEIGSVGYSKAMIASIAREIGADANKALVIFDAKSRMNLQEKKYHNFSEENKFLISTHLFSIIIIVIIVVILSSIIFHFYNKGMLNNPFHKNEVAVEQVEIKKTKPEVIKVKKQKNKQVNDGEIELKNKKVAEPENVETYKAVSDTTDLINQFIFKKKSSPFNPKGN